MSLIRMSSQLLIICLASAIAFGCFYAFFSCSATRCTFSIFHFPLSDSGKIHCERDKAYGPCCMCVCVRVCCAHSKYSATNSICILNVEITSLPHTDSAQNGINGNASISAQLWLERKIAEIIQIWSWRVAAEKAIYNKIRSALDRIQKSSLNQIRLCDIYLRLYWFPYGRAAKKSR